LRTFGISGIRAVTPVRTTAETRSFRATHVLALLFFGHDATELERNMTLVDALEPLLRAVAPAGGGSRLKACDFVREVFSGGDPSLLETVGDALDQLDRDAHDTRSAESHPRAGCATVRSILHYIAFYNGISNCITRNRWYREELVHKDMYGRFGLKGLEMRIMPHIEKRKAKFWNLAYGLYRFVLAKTFGGVVDNKKSPAVYAVDAAGYRLSQLLCSYFQWLNSSFHRKAVNEKTAEFDKMWAEKVDAFRAVFKELNSDPFKGPIMSAMTTNKVNNISHFGSKSSCEGAVQDCSHVNPLARQHEVDKMIITSNRRDPVVDQHSEGFVCPLTAHDGGNVAMTAWRACGCFHALVSLFPEGRLPGDFMHPAGFVPVPDGSDVPALVPGMIRSRVIFTGCFVGWIDVLPGDEARATVVEMLKRSVIDEQRRLLRADPGSKEAWELACTTFAWRTVGAFRPQIASSVPRDVDLHISGGRGRLVRPLLVKEAWDTPQKIEANAALAASRMSILDLQIRGKVEMVDASAFSAAGPVVGTIHEMLTANQMRRDVITHVEVHPSLRLSLLTSTLTDSTHNQAPRIPLAQHQVGALPPDPRWGLRPQTPGGGSAPRPPFCRNPFGTREWGSSTFDARESSESALPLRRGGLGAEPPSN
jgi:hypothetical protein